MHSAPLEKVLPEIPPTPTEEQWKAMSQEARDRFVLHVNDLLTEHAHSEAMTQGRPHTRARNRVLDCLGQYLRTLGTRIYLAEEMSVLYPGQRAFEPDVLAVRDVEDPGDDDERMAWVVADEGKGIDWVLDICYHGDRHKDFVFNVERYAALGICEYFIYDRKQQALKGYRLPDPKARRYMPLRPHFGRLASQVLGLDFAVIGGGLRFYHGEAELPGSGELIERLGRMVDELQARHESTEAKLGESEAKLGESEAKLGEMLEAQRRALVDVLAARGLPITDELRRTIDACNDGARLAHLIVRAVVVSSAGEIFEPTH